MTTRALYQPGRDRLPDGNALPAGQGEADREQRELVHDQLVADTPKPLWTNEPEYDALIAERMRTLTLAERIDVELRIIERRKTMHEVDYDPLKY